MKEPTKPSIFVDTSGRVSSLESLVRSLEPFESEGKFVVNAVLGQLGSGKSSTLNKLLDFQAFDTRESSRKDRQKKAEKDKYSLKIKGKDFRIRDDHRNDHFDVFKNMFEPHTDSVQVVLSQRTIGRWFVFDTPVSYHFLLLIFLFFLY